MHTAGLLALGITYLRTFPRLELSKWCLVFVADYSSGGCTGFSPVSRHCVLVVKVSLVPARYLAFGFRSIRKHGEPAQSRAEGVLYLRFGG